MRSPKNLLLAFFVFATLACATLAWRQHLELVSLRASAPIREQVVATTAATAVEPAVTESSPDPAELEVATAPIDPITPSFANAEPAARGPRFGRRDALMENPEVQRLMMIQRKAGLDDRYAGLFKALNLRPEQLEQLKELLVERMTVRNDVMGAARSQGLNPRTDRDAIAALVTNGEAEVDAAVRGLIGDAAYSQYQDYERTQPLRATVDRLEQRLSYSSTPLSAEQSAAMLSILDRTGAAAAPTIGRVGAVPDVAIEQARGVLAAPQLEALRQLQEEQRAQAEMSAAFRRQFEARRAAPPPTGGSTANAAPSSRN